MSRHELTKKATDWTWTREHGVRIWDVGSGKEVRRVGHMMMDCVALSTDGRLLASGMNWIDLWDMMAGKNLGRLPGELSFVYALAFSPDAKHLAASSYNQIRKHEELVIWDLVSRKVPSRLTRPETAILALEFSPDGRMLASAGTDGTVRLWEVESGKEMWQFQGHRGPVLALAFSASGKRLMSGGCDTTALIWDAYGLLLRDRTTIARLEPRVLDAAWFQLAGEDAHEAYLAMRTLVRVPNQTIPFLRQQLRAHPDIQLGRVGRWIADLDNDKFAIREKAETELASLGKAVEPNLREALQGQPSPEVRHRLNRLLEKLAGKSLPPPQLRGLRALTVLEQIGSPQAQQLLQASAKSDLGSRLTQEANASLARLRTRPSAD
jgi:hypothetical protein